MRNKFLFFILLILCVGLSGAAAQETGAPSNQTPKTISGGVVNGKALSLPKPAYPAAAKAVRAEGAVNVQVTIDEEGSVISATAVSGHPLLRAAAVKAAKQAKFSPTKLEGVPVKVTGVIVYNFVLPKTQKDNSDTFIPMGLAMFLTAFKEIPGDEETEAILREMANSLPDNYKVEKSQFDKLTKAKSGEKEKIIDDLVDSLKKGATESEAWSIDFGKQWGNAIGQAYKIADGKFRGDRQSFIKSLQGMNWLLESPPKDMPEEILEKIRAIASYNDETDAISPEFINDFFKSSLDFIQFMIDRSKSDN